MMNVLKNLFAPAGYQNITANEVQDLMKSKRLNFLDVRTPGEYAEGHIPEAKNINVNDNSFANKIAGLKKDSTYYVYCRSGMRSAKACKIMSENGFENVFNLNGGIGAWQGPVES